MERHLELMREAMATEGDAQRALLAADPAATAGLRAAADLYRASWEAAPAASYGRLIGMLKAAVIAGDATEAAAYAREQVLGASPSPAAAYALAIAALVQGDDAGARTAVARMRGGSPAFDRAAAAADALAVRDAAAYASALGEIVADFEGREDHLTGIPIADTAIMFECLAQPRGMASRPQSPLLPASSRPPSGRFRPD
jgi:hypothetical protein